MSGLSFGQGFSLVGGVTGPTGPAGSTGAGGPTGPTGPSIATPISPANGGSGVANSKNLTWSNSLTLAGTDATTVTFPATSDTMAGLGTAQTFSAANRFSGGLALGAADGVTAVAQSVVVQNVAAGNSNTAGADLTVNGSRGTGTGAGGKILLKTALAGTTGSTQNALVTSLTIGRGAPVLPNYIVANLPSASDIGAGGRAFVTDGSTTVILGLGLAVVGNGSNKVPVYSDGSTWIVG